MKKATKTKLTPNETKLLGMLEGKRHTKVDKVTRRSCREYDVEFEGRDELCRFSSWMVLWAIRELTVWTTPAIAVMTDYSDMTLTGDWSGVRDTNEDRLWAIFDDHVVPLVEKPVMTRF